MLSPILNVLKSYRADWLRFDIAAGLSVAAVSLPSAIAYPSIAGLPVEVGLFAAIFSSIGYALVGPSAKLMVGPDTGTCIMLAGILGTLGAAEIADRESLTIVITLVVGIFCLLGRFLRLGFLANFLSRPMLAGFLAGISVSLMIGQVKRFTGITISTEGLFRPLFDLAQHASETHIPTLAFGVSLLVILRLIRRFLPMVPGPLVGVVLAIAVSAAFDLQSYGVAVLGNLPSISFKPSLPQLDMLDSPRSVLNLLGGAIAVMLVGFGSGIITARSFAVKGGKDIDADDELLGFGVANLCSGFFGGFPVTASDSRTAVNYAIGGKTQLVGLISAGTLAISVLFIAQVLAYLPSAALGAVLVSAAIDLFDVGELRTLYKLRRSEFVFAMITILGVVIAGPMQGVFIAIAATLGDLLWSTSHPRLAFLGRIPGTTGLLKLHRFPEARPIPGLTIVVLQSPLVFFNADFVKMRLIKLSDASRSPQRWFVLDAAAVNVLDSTGLRKLEEFREYLATQGITFGIADLNSKARTIVDRSGLTEKIGNHMLFPSAEAAAAAFDALYKASTLDMQRPRAEITEA